MQLVFWNGKESGRQIRVEWSSHINLTSNQQDLLKDYLLLKKV